MKLFTPLGRAIILFLNSQKPDKMTQLFRAMVLCGQQQSYSTCNNPCGKEHTVRGQPRPLQKVTAEGLTKAWTNTKTGLVSDNINYLQMNVLFYDYLYHLAGVSNKPFKKTAVHVETT